MTTTEPDFRCPNCGNDSFQEIVSEPRANFVEVLDVIDGKPVFSEEVWDSKFLEGTEHINYECCSCTHPIEAYTEPEPPTPPPTIDPVTYGAAADYAPHVPEIAYFNGQKDGTIRTILAFSQQPHSDPIYEGAFADLAEFEAEHSRLESHPTTVLDVSKPPTTAHVDFTTSIVATGTNDLTDYLDVDLDAYAPADVETSKGAVTAESAIGSPEAPAGS